MSNSLLQAMATALPCVVSGIGGNTDLVGDGVTGRLVSTGDANTWSRTLLEVLDNPADMRRYGDAARHRIDDKSRSTWSSTGIWTFTAG